MKKFLFFLFGFLLFSGTSYAQHIGPGVPAMNWIGNIATPNFGIGYNYSQAEWDGIEIESQQAYAHFGAVFGDISTPYYEVYLRLGAANLESDDIFDLEGYGLNSSRYDGDTDPMYAVGIKGEFCHRRIFGWGGVLQAMYVDSFEDSISGNYLDEDYKAELSLENYWEVELAFPIHAKINNGVVYLGPLFYHSTADVVAEIDVADITVTVEDDADEDHNVGAVGGVAFRFSNVSLELEAKYKSDFSAGALLTFTF